MKIVGHRGARHLAPENTIAALQAALKHGVDEIEIDVRVTKDGHVVLAHDPVLRIDGRTYAVSAHTVDELRQHKPDLTTLAEAIRAVDRKVPLMIEIKSKEPVEPIVSVIERFLAEGWTSENFIFGSFSQSILRKVHESLPQVQIVIIEAFSAYRAMRRANQVNTKKVSISHHVLWFANVARMRRKNFEVYTWTLNNPRKARHLKRFGLAGAVTDNPTLYKD